jgi:hypothetical protein
MNGVAAVGTPLSRAVIQPCSKIRVWDADDRAFKCETRGWPFQARVVLSDRSVERVLYPRACAASLFGRSDVCAPMGLINSPSLDLRRKSDRILILILGPLLLR